SQKEINLRNRTIINPIQNEPDIAMDEIPPEVTFQPKASRQKIKLKSQPSVIDQIEPYDIANDILNMKSSATLGQMLQQPSQ
ncbi:8466_t:CDS:1, partial [Gigaspora rosea]